MPKYSIIVPFYKVEKYIHQCLSSIIEQDYYNFEVICVNDKSPDASAEIVEQFVQKDSRFKLINLNSNRGVGYARNKGLEAAKGEFVTFVDSDDWIAPNYLSKIDEVLCEKPDLKCLIFKPWIYYETSDLCTINMYYPAYFHQLEGWLNLNESNIINHPIYCWNKVYNLNFLKQHNIIFSERYYEELRFFYPLVLLLKDFYVLDEFLYYYRQIGTSFTKTSEQSVLIKKSIDIFLSAGDTIEYLENRNISPKYKDALLKFVNDNMVRYKNTEYYKFANDNYSKFIFR